MKAVTYSLFVLTHILSVFGSPVVYQQNSCLRDSPCATTPAQSMISALSDGIPEFGIERLDTMYIDGFHIPNLDGFEIDWKNVYLKGLKNTIVDEFSIDMKSKVIRLVFHTDLSVEGNYVANSHLLCLPFYGAGQAIINFYNIQMDFTIPFQIKRDINGRNVVDLKCYRYDFNIRQYTTFHFGNLYNGNPNLSQIMHTGLHQNWKVLTAKYSRYLFDKSNDKIFNAIRTFLRYLPLETASVNKIAYRM